MCIKLECAKETLIIQIMVINLFKKGEIIIHDIKKRGISREGTEKVIIFLVCPSFYKLSKKLHVE